MTLFRYTYVYKHLQQHTGNIFNFKLILRTTTHEYLQKNFLIHSESAINGLTINNRINKKQCKLLCRHFFLSKIYIKKYNKIKHKLYNQSVMFGKLIMIRPDALLSKNKNVIIKLHLKNSFSDTIINVIIIF